ncbi:LLM class F420-dependent oxidoreductase [Streptomyces sp. NPDC048277]|uniref:LLM class F420-dependent oxidoreductase n=1 Tax=Streptomyces sp. NPDC048277 TaxID=3155027 RepID=UPI00340055EF
MIDTANASPDLARLKESIGRYGAWSMALRVMNPSQRAELGEVARELEEAGYGAVWIGGSPSVQQITPLVEETSHLTVGTSILSIWDHKAESVAQQFAQLEEAHPGRFLLGLGVSHATLVNERYRRPLSAMAGYLDDLDAGGQPGDRRLIAALGPKMLKLARDRSAGSLPYHSTVEHTAQAREALGDAALLAPEVKVLLETDPDRARAIGRMFLPTTVTPNYTNNLLRAGFTEEDLANGGSDRLVDALIAWGDEQRIKERLDMFFAAGADHVAIQVITDKPAEARQLTEGQPLHPEVREGWRRLANVLLS